MALFLLKALCSIPVFITLTAISGPAEGWIMFCFGFTSFMVSDLWIRRA
jgi:hypothetical protein